jgi:hypothetical protein
MLFAELKKIWRPGIVLILLIVSVLFSFSFLYQWIKPFTWENDSFQVELEILSDLIDKYGNSIDNEEFARIEDDYQNILYQGTSVIEENTYFQEQGVQNYEDYLQYAQNAINGYDGYDYNVYSEMRHLIEQNTGYSSMYLQEYESIMQKYKSSGSENNSILPVEVMVYTNNYLVYLTMLCMICVFFVSAPVMVSDRMNNVVAAQYSSRRGKKIYRIQYFGMMLSSVLIVSMVVLIALSAWKTTGAMVFADSNLSSFLNTGNPVLNLTYGNYIGWFVIMMYALSLGISSIIFLLSAHSSNMIAMLLKTLPILVIGCIVAMLLQDAFFEENTLYHLLKIKYCEIYVVFMLFAAGLIINVGNIKLLKTRDSLG